MDLSHLLCRKQGVDRMQFSCLNHVLALEKGKGDWQWLHKGIFSRLMGKFGLTVVNHLNDPVYRPVHIAII